ncbi:thioredoxin domain-containing protein [Leucobacter sp. CSA1]|uniref:Thioredoxin domain-containing protein n=1 Tax=Leucobacter chromiisoli TaxID=2796471 RepID=A0A934UUP6_9MICO|nr:thioredoxin domain-containing protein [Leucobacter chromiisoli]MBK0418398.1 thioredoxin domain-containing protein [Leucobacter chromiisoli]
MSDEPQTHRGTEPVAGAPGPSGPPPNPFAGAARPVRGGGLGVAAMAAGLAALLTSGVAALYFSPFTVAGAVIGIAALALGAVSLARRTRPIWPSVAGVVAGGLAVAVALASGVLATAALLAPDGPTAGAGAGSAPGADPEQQLAVEWPRNMATGGILLEEGMSARRSDAPAHNALPSPLEADRASGPTDIRLYVDYRCPYCAVFEEASGDALEEAVNAGEATLEIHPLTFLDSVSQGSSYSSRAAAAVACVADAQPADAWSAHRALLDPTVQPPENTPGYDNREIGELLGHATGGLGDEARSCIEAERFVPFAQALGSWISANPVPGAQDPGLRVEGTPLAVVNGAPYPGDPADPAAFRDFLAEQGVRL